MLSGLNLLLKNSTNMDFSNLLNVRCSRYSLYIPALECGRRVLTSFIRCLALGGNDDHYTTPTVYNICIHINAWIVSYSYSHKRFYIRTVICKYDFKFSMRFRRLKGSMYFSF